MSRTPSWSPTSTSKPRGSDPQPQSSSLALPCQILVSVDGCQSLTAFGSCIHWMPAPSRRPKNPAGTAGKRVPGGHNRRRRLATRRCDTKRAGTTAVVPATIEWQQCLLHLHFFDTLKEASEDASFRLSKNPDWLPSPANSALRPTPPHVCGQALRYACAWLRASWLSAISGASRPSASLGGGLRTAVALRAVLVLGAAHP